MTLLEIYENVQQAVETAAGAVELVPLLIMAAALVFVVVWIQN